MVLLNILIVNVFVVAGKPHLSNKLLKYVHMRAYACMCARVFISDDVQPNKSVVSFDFFVYTSYLRKSSS